MSWLSQITGVGISKKGVKINPKQLALTALGVGIPALGMAGKLGALASGASKGRGVLGALGTAGGFLKNNARTIADVGMVGERVYDRMQQNKVAGEMQNRYRSLQPLRDKALAELSAPTPDTSSIFADPDAMPSRYRRVNVGSRGGY